jgi:hypothetical protein
MPIYLLKCMRLYRRGKVPLGISSMAAIRSRNPPLRWMTLRRGRSHASTVTTSSRCVELVRRASAVTNQLRLLIFQCANMAKPCKRAYTGGLV